jgi:hypothetical protein
MRTIKSLVIGLYLSVGGSCVWAEEGIWLPMQASCRSDAIVVASDTFRAVLSSRAGISIGLDRWDVLEPPAGPSGLWLQAVTRDSGRDLAIDFRPGTGGSADAVFPIEIILQTSNEQEFAGIIQLELPPPDLLSAFGEDTQVFVQQWDASGHFMRKADLRKNPTILEWNHDGPGGKIGLARLVIVRNCIAVNINRIGKVDLADLAKLASAWQQTDWLGSEDINGDTSVDLIDLAMLAEAWLETCPSDQ